MIRVPLTAHAPGGRSDGSSIDVSAEDDDGYVALTVRPEEGRTFGPIEGHRYLVALMDEALDSERTEAVTVNRRTLEQLYAHASGDVDRSLTAEEARALASALWHYAGEVER